MLTSGGFSSLAGGLGLSTTTAAVGERMGSGCLDGCEGRKVGVDGLDVEGPSTGEEGGPLRPFTSTPDFSCEEAEAGRRG